jgi:phenylacetate-CoA ligase
MGPPPRDPDQQFWDPEVQTMDPERRRELQLQRLRELIAKVFDRDVGLFRRKLTEAGITSAQDITDLEDINKIPTTLKQDLRDSEAEHPPLGDYRFTPLSECVRIGQSTGTTGTPTITVLTRHDLWIEYESAARNWWRNGWRPGQVVTHCHPAYLYGGGLMLSGTLEYFGFLNLWVPPPDTDELAEQAIRVWQRIHPDISMAMLSMHRFQEVSAKLGIDLKTDCGFPDFKMGGFGRGLMPLMTAGFECYAYLGGPNDVSDGAHIHEDWAIVQAIDPATGADVPDGQWGNLVVTTLDRDNGLLRYDLEEAAMFDSTPCPTGETTKRGFWGGRFKDLLSCQGRHFQVMDLEKAISEAAPEACQPTLEFVVVNPQGSADPLRVRLEVGAVDTDREALADKVRAGIRDAFGVESTVEVLDRETLPRSGYKLKRVVDA